MNSLGIYFGSKAITIAETKGKKLINSSRIPQSAVSGMELEEKVPSEIKAGGIVSLLSDELRKLNIKAKEAMLCLSGNDLIIRTFEMPVMPHEELSSAINFEVKKYIPFKIEEMISDFQVRFDRASRINIVLFAGIKKETLNKYVSILGQSGLKIGGIEYSAFSILRCLKLAGLNAKGVIGVLASDLKEEDEISFTVLEDGFPLFSRDIVLTAAHEGFGGFDISGEDAILERLKTEIRVSLDYYHRKFPTKNVKKIFVLADPRNAADIESRLSDTGFSFQFMNIDKILGSSAAYSLSFTKAYTASLYRTLKLDIRINLLRLKARPEPRREKLSKISPLYLVKRIGINKKALALGILACGLTFVFGFYRLDNFRRQLYSVSNERILPANVSGSESVDTLINIESEYKNKLNTLDNLVKGQVYVTVLLNVITKSLPDGVWLNTLNYQGPELSQPELMLSGSAYLKDSRKESEAVNKFISNLQESPELKQYFKKISTASVDRSVTEGVNATDFAISCK